MGNESNYWDIEYFAWGDKELYTQLMTGVDLNRNYDWDFNGSGGGNSADICSETYKGPFAFSEPET